MTLRLEAGVPRWVKWHVLYSEMRKHDRRTGLRDGENQVDMFSRQLDLRREVKAEDTRLGVISV
mgnify:CR=1 FL=1